MDELNKAAQAEIDRHEKAVSHPPLPVASQEAELVDAQVVPA